MHVLDTSVVVKWYVEEEDSDKARILMQNHLDGKSTLVVPDLLIYEVANALKYSGAFSEKEICESVQDLYDLKLDIIAPLPSVIYPAIKISLTKDIAFYDAFYLALAQEIKSPLITADKKLYQKVKDLEFVKLLTEFEPSPFKKTEEESEESE